MGKAGADDIGPPRAIRDKWLRQSGMTLWGVRAHWKDAEPKRLPDVAAEKDFDWSAFDKDLDAIPPRMAVQCRFSLDAPWAEELKKSDEDQYWRLAERFIEFAARRAHAHGVRYYRVPGNETSLTGRPDWPELYMKPVRHYAKAIHRGHPDNQVIAGALVVGSKDLIDLLYEHGFKEHCDILDIHAYPGTPGESRYHVGISQIIESHKALEAHGDGHKRIFLGEGWSAFPLPVHLDKLKDPPKYTEDDIRHYRECIVNGYYAITTPRPDYDPGWVLGASFFCLNDLWGSMGWKQRAKILYNKDGDPEFWELDGYKLPYEPGAMDPQFRAWGIIDIEGNPKGDIVKHFPPYIPRAAVAAELVDKAAAVYPGKPHKVRITLTNRDPEPITNPRFSMYVFTGGGRKDVEFRSLDKPVPASLAQGESASREFEVVLKPAAVGHEVRLQCGCDYNWLENPYYADNWLKITVASPGAFQLNPFTALADRADHPINLAFVLTNRTGAPLPDKLDIEVDKAVTAAQSSKSLGSTMREYAVTLKKADPTAGGFYTVKATAGQSFDPISAGIAFPNPGRTPEKAPARGRLISPGFEDFGPGSGFEGWDGPPSNHSDPEMAADLPNHGSRMITKVYCNSKYPAENSQVVLLPDGFKPGGTVTASVWTKGVAFAKATDHDALRFRISIVWLDSAGKDLRRDDSPYLKGTSKWEKLDFTTPASPASAASLRLILLHENTNHADWHKAALDSAELRFN